MPINKIPIPINVILSPKYSAVSFLLGIETDSGLPVSFTTISDIFSAERCSVMPEISKTRPRIINDRGFMIFFAERYR